MFNYNKRGTFHCPESTIVDEKMAEYQNDILEIEKNPLKIKSILNISY